VSVAVCGLKKAEIFFGKVELEVEVEEREEDRDDLSCRRGTVVLCMLSRCLCMLDVCPLGCTLTRLWQRGYWQRLKPASGPVPTLYQRHTPLSLEETSSDETEVSESMIVVESGSGTLGTEDEDEESGNEAIAILDD